MQRGRLVSRGFGTKLFSIPQVGSCYRGDNVSESIIIVGDFRICEGKFEKLKVAMAELAELVKAKEPQIIAYNAYLNENSMQLIVLQVHYDSASAEFHMGVTGSAFPKELINLSLIDIYGTPSQSLLDKLRLSETTGVWAYLCTNSAQDFPGSESPDRIPETH